MMTSYEIATLGVLSGTAAIMVIQAAIAVHSFRQDHRRRKREATIQHMNHIRKEYRQINGELLVLLGTDRLQDEQISKLLVEGAMLAKVKDLLGLFEHLAVGVNLNVFDLMTLNRMSGMYLIHVFERYSRYIEFRRQATQNSLLYCEYEGLITEICRIRRIPRPIPVCPGTELIESDAMKECS